MVICMDSEKLREIINNKNEQRERHMTRSAEDIIDNILKEQANISASNERIVKLREELKSLTVTPIDPSSVLGGN